MKKQKISLFDKINFRTIFMFIKLVFLIALACVVFFVDFEMAKRIWEFIRQ
jgi:hypothetical protein